MGVFLNIHERPYLGESEFCIVFSHPMLVVRRVHIVDTEHREPAAVSDFDQVINS